MAKRAPEPTELELLRQHAEDLWEQQQQVFAKASRVAREAGRQGVVYTRDELAPRVRQAYSTSADAVRGFADSTKDTVTGKVIPAVTGAVGSTLATIGALSDKSVRQALAGVSRLRGGAPVPIVAVPAKRGIGVGGWIGIGLGVLAAGAVAYAVWQTLRADDELWIEEFDTDETPELAAGE